MGWLIYDYTPSDIKAEIESLCTFSSDTGSGNPLYIQRYGSTWFAAVEVHRKDVSMASDYEVDLNGRYVFAAVFLTTTENGGWGYKDMDETSGPAIATASPKLINMLSKTTSAYANSWRTKCLEHAKKQSRKLKDGDSINFTNPITFSDGVARRCFKVHILKYPCAKRAKTQFECLKTSAMCNIAGYKTMDWEWVA